MTKFVEVVLVCVTALGLLAGDGSVAGAVCHGGLGGRALECIGH